MLAEEYILNFFIRYHRRFGLNELISTKEFNFSFTNFIGLLLRAEGSQNISTAESPNVSCNFLKDVLIMKILLSISFALLTHSFSYGQVYKDSIRNQFLSYTKALIEKKFLESTNYLNQDFLKIIPKNQLVLMMEKTYNNPTVSFIIETPTVNTIADSKNISGKTYSKFSYSNYLNLRFISEEGKEQDTTLTRKALESQFGHSNVTYNSLTETYKIFVTKNVIADSKDKRNWTFVVVEEKQKPILKQFIPQELL